MKFGLILCTYGRNWSVVGKFIHSLVSNTYKNWELIIVDQNEDSRIEKGLREAYSSYLQEGKIKYYKVNFKGLSASRNYGLSKLSSDVDIVGFPDDDCEYPENLLSNVVSKFSGEPYLDIVTGKGWDRIRGMNFHRFLKKDSRVHLGNLWIGLTSFTIFIRLKRLDIDEVKFDENLGVGSSSIFGSGEEMDLIIRLLSKGYKSKFFTDIVVHHPYKDAKSDINRAIYYAAGMGAVFRKNFMLNPRFLLGFLNNMMIRPIGGIFVSLLKLNLKDAKYYTISLLSRWLGFLAWGYYYKSKKASNSTS